MEKHKQHEVQGREIVEAVDKLYSQYGKYALPDQEARKIVDQAMGSKTLSEALESIREG